MTVSEADGRIQATDATNLNLGCGEDYREGWHNVDADPLVDPDEILDLDDYPWPFENESFKFVLASHVFEHLENIEQALTETARILKPGGRLEVRYPIGLDYVADPDHIQEHRWDWNTPLMYCGERHWDIDVGLEVVDRQVALWAQSPGLWKDLREFWWRFLFWRYGPGRWCFGRQAVSGEFIVTFEREGDQ